jgi:transposase
LRTNRETIPEGFHDEVLSDHITRNREASQQVNDPQTLPVNEVARVRPDMNPVEGIWSLLKRSTANFAAADLDGLVRIVKRKLKKIQYRPHLIDGCLAGTGLIIEPW